MPSAFCLAAKYFFDFTHVPQASCFNPEESAWKMLALMQNCLDQRSDVQIKCPVPQGVMLVNPESIHIEEDCVLEPGCYIQGPCHLGAGTHVRHGAYLRGYVLTGRGCVIGHASEVKNALFCDGAKAAHFAYVGDSLLGHEVNLGAGTKCANLRFDHQELAIHTPGQVYKTGIRKLGAVIGDFSQLGCNSVTSPGTFLGPHSWVWPLVYAKGFYPAHSRLTKSEPLSAH
jgi:NDP-sugar pyrophosphorylase family protein